MQYLIGLDLGTTTVKAVLYTIDGNPVAEANLERILLTPKAGFYEQDALSWYYDSAAVIKQAVEKAGICADDVIGLSISSQGITTVAVDENFDPLHNAINWMDVRPVEGWKAYLDSAGFDYVRANTGFPISYQKPKGVAKLIWLKENLPDVFNHAYYFLMPASFVTAKLTGKAVTDHTMAAGSLLYSNFTANWDEKLLNASGIDINKLPEIVLSGAPVAYLTEKAAKDCGLTQNCLVSCGGQDQKVSAYAVDVKDKMASCSFGTSAAFEFISSSCENNYNDNYKVCPYIEKNKFAIETCINTAGGAIRWVRDTVCGGADFDIMNAEVSDAPVASNGLIFLPFLGGHPSGKGFGTFVNVGLHTTRGDIIRSVYEGIAYEARFITEALEKMPESVVMFSGGSKSSVLCQILADVLGVTVSACKHSEIGSLGAAKLALKGLDGNISDFGKNILKNSSVYAPLNHEKYSEAYEAYKSAR